MKYLSLLTLGLLFLSSCIKEEIPIAMHASGDLVSNQIELGINYKHQVYYDIETNAFVKQHLKTDWDLGFEPGPQGSRIVLNMSKVMAVAKITSGSFATVSDTIGAKWKYDVSSGNLDSTAIGNWEEGSGLYLIDRGYSFDGTHQGFRKVVFISVDETTYEIQYSNLDGSDEFSSTILKNDTHNFSFLSFDTNVLVDIQPPKEDWDLVFGQFAHLFEPTFPYLVTGVLANRNGVQCTEIFDKTFGEITIADISNYAFSSDINVIGYDWKTFVGGTYTVHPEKNYVVKTTEGLYYKLHFIDFYNNQGEKGSPQFEIAAL